MMNTFTSLPALCRLIRIGVALFLAATLIAHLWLWFSLGDVKLGVLTFFIHSGDLDSKSFYGLSMTERLITILVSLPALICLVLALFKLLKLMGYFERREFFAMESILLLKSFCGAIFLYILCSVFEPAARILVFTLVGSAQQQTLVLHLTESFDELLICGMFYVIVRILEEGRRLAEENSEFI